MPNIPVITTETWGAFKSARELLEFYDGLSSNNSPPGLVQVRPPKEIVSVSIKGMDEATMLALQATVGQYDSTHTFTLSNGDVVEGIVVDFTASPIEHSGFYNVQCQVRVDGVLTVTWYYWGSYTSTKELKEFYGGVPGVYSQYTLVDDRPPKKTVGLSARGLTSAQWLSIASLVDQQGQTASFTTGDNLTWTGVVISVTASPIEHTGLYDVKITLREDGSLTNILWQWWGHETIEKELKKFYAAPSATGAYGAVTIYDQKLPSYHKQLTATGVDITSAGQIKEIALAAPPSNVSTFTLADGSQVVGIVGSYSSEDILYTALKRITVTVVIQ